MLRHDFKAKAIRKKKVKGCNSYNDDYYIVCRNKYLTCGDSLMGRHTIHFNKNYDMDSHLKNAQKDFIGFEIKCEDPKDCIKKEFPEFYYLAKKLKANIKDNKVKGINKHHAIVLFRIIRMYREDFREKALIKICKLVKEGMPIIKAFIIGNLYTIANLTNNRRYEFLSNTKCFLFINSCSLSYNNLIYLPYFIKAPLTLKQFMKRLETQSMTNNLFLQYDLMETHTTIRYNRTILSARLEESPEYNISNKVSQYKYDQLNHLMKLLKNDQCKDVAKLLRCIPYKKQTKLKNPDFKKIKLIKK